MVDILERDEIGASRIAGGCRSRQPHYHTTTAVMASINRSLVLVRRGSLINLFNLLVIRFVLSCFCFCFVHFQAVRA